MKWVFTVAALLGLPCCYAPEEGTPEETTPEEGSWATTQVGSDAWLGLSVIDSQVTGYVCGGATTVGSNTRWFTGPLGGESFDVERDGWTLRGERSDGAFQGELVDPRGMSSPWLAPRVFEQGLGGLYAAVDAGCRAGAIVAQSDADDAPALQGAWCDDSGAVFQVTPVVPVSRSTDRRAGIALVVTLPAGDHEFVVYPLRAEPR